MQKHLMQFSESTKAKSKKYFCLELKDNRKVGNLGFREQKELPIMYKYLKLFFALAWILE